MDVCDGADWRAEFTAYVDANYRRLVAVARSVLGHESCDAEDAVQDALVTLVRKWRRVRQAENIDAYVTRMVVNESRTRLRRTRRRSDVEQSVALASSLQCDETVYEEIADLRLAIKSLPVRQREAVALYYVFDMPLEQVALAMKTSEGTAKSQLFKARSALRAKIEREPRHA